MIMRCLVVADLHYSLPQFDWLLSAAPHFDLVIFAGDALDVGSFVDFRAQIVVVRKYLTLLSGITRVILPAENERDLDDIPQDVRDKMEFNLVESMDEVTTLALDGTIVPLAAKEKLPEPEKVISPDTPVTH